MGTIIQANSVTSAALILLERRCKVVWPIDIGRKKMPKRVRGGFLAYVQDFNLQFFLPRERENAPPTPEEEREALEVFTAAWPEILARVRRWQQDLNPHWNRYAAEIIDDQVVAVLAPVPPEVLVKGGIPPGSAGALEEVAKKVGECFQAVMREISPYLG